MSDLISNDKGNVSGLAQAWHNSIANALELHPFNA